MDYFDRLGALVERLWSEAREDLAAFPAVAERALTELPPHQHTSVEALLDWVASTPALPSPQQLGSPFGQPPLEVYLRDAFRIECLCWADATTDIHDHRFSGAFHVLGGSSIHSRWKFTPRDAHGDSVALGDLSIEAIEILRVGQTRQIVPGAGLVHALFHLDLPSVTVVVRTWQDPLPKHQRSYYSPGLAVASTPDDELTARSRQVITLMHRTGDPALSRRLAAMVTRAPAAAGIHLLLHAHRLTADDQVMRPALDAFRTRHGAALADVVEVALVDHYRATEVATLRGRVLRPDHRFFLGVLMNAPGRAAALRLIHDRFPDQDPAKLTGTWLRALSGTLDVEGSVGFDFDEVHHEILELAMAGRDDDGILAGLAERYDDASMESQDEALREEIAVMRASFLRPLFRP